MLYKCFRFVDFFLKKKKLCNFCFRLDDFKRPFVIQGFCRVFLLTDIVFRGNARSYIPEKIFPKYSWASLGLDIEYRSLLSTSKEISLNSSIESSFTILFHIVTFLLLQSSLCFIEIVKIGKWSEISFFKILVNYSWSIKELVMM